MEKTVKKKSKSGVKKKKVSSKSMPSKKRTKSGSIKPAVRKKSATVDGDKFPIFDKKSAVAALILRGHGTTDEERKKIIRKAKKYAPDLAESAKEADKKKGL